MIIALSGVMRWLSSERSEHTLAPAPSAGVETKRHEVEARSDVILSFDFAPHFIRRSAQDDDTL